jgi:DNA-binding LytR/AlgR family response regulator
MRFLIVGDDRISAGALSRALGQTLGSLGRRVTAIRTLKDPRKAKPYLQRIPIDFLLLDLDVAGAASLLDEPVAQSFKTIAIASGTQHAPRAIEKGVAGYLVKPVTLDPLARTLARLLGMAPAANGSGGSGRCLPLRTRGAIRLIPIDALVYARGAGPYAELVMKDGSTIFYNRSLSALRAALPATFERIHRSYIVSTSAIAGFIAHEGTRYEVQLHGGERLPVGRGHYKRLRALMG